MDSTRTVPLTDFLLARIAEDERAARACALTYPPPWDVSDRGHSATVRADEPNFYVVTDLDQDQALGAEWLSERLEHIARHDPARVVAECEAKRRIVEAVESKRGTYITIVAAYELLDALAAVYADHPDYREEWRP